jgi:hypothetical protein
VKRLAVVLAAAAAVLLSACGPAESGSLGPAPTGAPAPPTTAAPVPSPPESPPASTASPAPPGTTGPGGGASATPAAGLTIQLWFTRGGRLFPTRRTRPTTLETSKLALTELTAGPSTVESAARVDSALVPRTTFRIKSLVGGVETVSFPNAFFAGGADVVRMRQAQVVYTLTQFPTVTRVNFVPDVEGPSASGTRADYADLLPQILVTNLVIGQRVPNPVTVAGSADVFESTVSLRILDVGGREIASTFTTASLCTVICTGHNRGDFRVAVPYRVPREQRGTIEVFSVSMADGSRLFLVDLPVVLTP